MKRVLACTALVVLAACGSSSKPSTKTETPAERRAAIIQYDFIICSTKAQNQMDAAGTANPVAYNRAVDAYNACPGVRNKRTKLPVPAKP